MTFEGKYFDGKSSVGYPATVSLSNFALDIIFSDGISSQRIEWLPAKIHANDFAENHKVYLKYGDYPFQYLEINDNNFGRELKLHFPDAKFHKTTFNFIFSTGVIGLVTLAVAFIGLLLLSYFVLLPAAAERVAVNIPMAWEKQLGDAAYSKMVDDEDSDTENSRRANAFFKQLHYQSSYPVEITVVKENVVNAFALPGGRIVVYEGILRTMDSSQQLTALLSHEFSHVELKHSTKNIFRSLSSYLLLSLLFGDASGVTAVVIQNADQLKQLGYSRSLEEEADNNGLKLMKERGIDPQGLAELFKALKKEEGAAGQIPQFLSTHPLTTERIKTVQKEIAKHDYTVREDAVLDSLFWEIKKNLNE